MKNKTTSSTPNRKDAYMGAMKKTETKPRSSMSASDPKSKPMQSKLAPTKSPRTKSAPRIENMGPAGVSFGKPSKFTYREGPGEVPATSTSKLAPKSSPRTVPNPKAPAPASSKRPMRDPRKKQMQMQKQKNYPGYTRLNYPA